METQCSIDGCDAPARTRGWCHVHYMRWYTKGDPGVAEIIRRPKGRTCSLEGCDRKHQGRGYCDTHLQRFIKYGDPGPAEIEARRPGATCSVEGCEGPHRGRGYCDKHYQRWVKYGDPLGAKTPAATYSAIHFRLRKERGRAGGMTCVRCGGPAVQWAYDHTDPDERWDPASGLPFSLDLDRYQPLCLSCHRRLDAPRKTCSAAGCDSLTKAKGLCSKHYQRMRTARLRA